MRNLFICRRERNSDQFGRVLKFNENPVPKYEYS